MFIFDVLVSLLFFHQFGFSIFYCTVDHLVRVYIFFLPGKFFHHRLDKSPFVLNNWNGNFVLIMENQWFGLIIRIPSLPANWFIKIFIFLHHQWHFVLIESAFVLNDNHNFQRFDFLSLEPISTSVFQMYVVHIYYETRSNIWIDKFIDFDGR